MRLPITFKILVAGLVTVAMVLWVTGFFVNKQERLAGLMDEMIQKNMAAMRLAEQIKYNYVLYDDLVFRYLFTNDPLLLTESARVRDRMRGATRQMKQVASGETEQELLSEIEEETVYYDRDVKRLMDTYAFSTAEQKKSVLDLIQNIESGRYSSVSPVREQQRQTLALLSAEGSARLTRLYSSCEKLTDISRAKLEEAQSRVRENVEGTQRTAYWASLAVGVAALVVAGLLALSLLSPLKNLLRGVAKVTAGDLNLELPVEGSDEIGRLTQEFNTMIRQLRGKQEKLLAETITDSLTELYNFRYFQTRLKDEVSRSSRYQRPFSLLILDIDHFKHYNDTNGHQMGNVVLKQVAATLRESLRREDFLARYGGEEFVAILPETDQTGAAVAAERLRQSIEQTDFPARSSQPSGRITISLGGAVFPAHGVVAAGLIEKADKALYAAKQDGRNRIVWAAVSEK